jgi:hypothetical protein
MQAEVYADGIGEITVTGAIVRIDLVSLSPSERDSANQPVPVFRQRIIMSMEGFANSFEVMQKAMHGLIEGGAIRRTSPEESGVPESRGQGPSPAPRMNGSPNFT